MNALAKTFVMLAVTSAFMGSVAVSGNQYLLQLVLGVTLIAILALSWDILCRVGQVSLGQAAFFGLGAYAYAMAGGINATVAWIAVPVICGVVAAVIGMLTLRLQHVYFSIATLGFTLSLQVLVLALAEWTGGAGGISPLPIGFGDDASQLAGITIVLLSAICASQYFLSKNVRPALFMIRTRPELAAVSGVPLVRTKILNLVVSAILAGLAGACYGGLYGYIVPTDVFVLNWSIVPLAVAILGGRDSTIGPILGAVVLRLLEEAARSIVGGVGYQVVYGAVIILCILLMPNGILGAIRKLIIRPTAREMAKQPLRVKEFLKVEAGSTLEVEGVTVAFDGLQALSDLSVSFEKGAITGLIGPNGSGKSTLVNNIVGDVRARSGSVRYGERTILGKRPDQIVSFGIARTYQIPRFPPELTIREIIDVTLHYVNRAQHLPVKMRNAQAIATFCALAQPIDTQCSHLSVPDLRRLEIARALACGPSCLFLDEVMAGLSHEDQLAMIALVKEINGLGVTVVIIEHVMRIISSLCHRTVVLNSGKLLATGAPAKVLGLAGVREAYLGRSFKI